MAFSLTWMQLTRCFLRMSLPVGFVRHMTVIQQRKVVFRDEEMVCERVNWSFEQSLSALNA